MALSHPRDYPPLTLFPDAQSMRDVIFGIDNEQDFKKFILGMESKLPAQSQPAEIKYEKHPVRTPPFLLLRSQLTFPTGPRRRLP